MSPFNRKVTVKATVWFEVPIDAYTEDATHAAAILNNKLADQNRGTKGTNLPHIIDWIVSEPEQED